MQSSEIIENLFQPKKKVKLETQTDIINIQIKQIKQQQTSNLKTIQSILTYIFLDQNAPLWFSINHKQQIEYCINLNIEIQQCLFFQMLLIKNSLPFLKQIYSIDKKVYFQNCDNLEETWEQLLYCQKSICIKKQQNNQKSQPESYENQIYNRYLNYRLSEEDLRKNNFPNDKQKKYEKYINTNNWNNKQIEFKNKILAMDCEMVTTSKQKFELARISIINYKFEVIYDKFVKPQNQIINYNTRFSGITQQILKNVTTRLIDVQNDLKQIISSDTIFVGHSLENDLNALKIIHELVIDTSILYMMHDKKQSLKFLSSSYLNSKIQKQTHDSIEDCKGTLGLAKLKIEIMQYISPERKIEFNLLKKLLYLKHTVLIFDENSEQFLKYGIHCQNIQQDQSINSVGKRLRHYFNKNQMIPKIILAKLRYQQPIQQSWQKYYVSLDKQIQKIYEHCPKHSLVIINFEINNKIRILSADSQFIKVKPFCIFKNKKG